jgi:23S rRNA U2552 (ribose-2'-O)-methylase RlmE/FtsJ
MHNHDFNRVEFFSKEDMAAGHQLSKGEHILRKETLSNYTDINDILELYNIKKYIDNDLYLRDWTQEDIEDFKQKVTEYGKIIGQFISKIDNNNIVDLYEKTQHGYISTFWEIVNNQRVFKRISKSNFSNILSNESHLIHEILKHKALVSHYDTEIKSFLLSYSQSAEILLSIYEVQDNFGRVQKFVPKSLTIEDKENIVSTYLDSTNVNLNYIGLIQNVRNGTNFRISDKTRLKAKRLHTIKTKEFFAEKRGMEYGVSVTFPENASKIKDGFFDENFIAHYSYSLDFIKQNNNPYKLFQNFKYLFEYTDNQNRISLVSKKTQMGFFERIMGVHSQNEYRGGTAFNLSEMTSHVQIVAYNKLLGDLNNSLEKILYFVFTTVFQEKYIFADNARFSIPTATSYFEKVRLLAPEFESALKQFKLFVKDGIIDFELLQMSSTPTAIKDIPSINDKKYIYFNEKNETIVGCSNLFFSDQTLLAYVEPYREEKYHTFFDLIANKKVKFSNYEDHQKPQLTYLIDNGFISIDSNGFIQILNPARVLILKDLNDNEVGSYYHYPTDIQQEAKQMEIENIINFESTLFSKPEQAYFNYFLNKSEFTNGLDLRNSYLHGTQAHPDELEKHEYAYFTYLKLLFLAMLKIDDDLMISNVIKNRK